MPRTMQTKNADLYNDVRSVYDSDSSRLNQLEIENAEIKRNDAAIRRNDAEMHQINLELQSAIAAIQKRDDDLRQQVAQIQKTDAARFTQLEAEIQTLFNNQKMARSTAQ
jgi:predicted  nucleic acid-binding Zn-ribbon protein